MTTQEIINSINEDISTGNINLAKKKIGNLAISCRKFGVQEEKQFLMTIENVKNEGGLFEPFDDSKPLISKNKSVYTVDDFDDAVYNLKNNLCDERVQDVITIGRAVYGNNNVETGNLYEENKKENMHSAEKINSRNNNIRIRTDSNRSSNKHIDNEEEINPMAFVLGALAVIGTAVVVGKILFK